MAGRLEQYSFSRMQLFDNCPLTYAARYGGDREQTKVPFVSSFALESGRGVHSCIEKYVEHLQASELPQDLEVLPTVIEEVFSKDREVRSTEVFNDVWFTFGKFAREYRHDFERYVGGELHLTRELEGLDAEIIGYPDHVAVEDYPLGDGQSLQLIVAEDWKTGWKAEVTDALKFQGEVMCWLMAATFPDKPVGYRVNFVRRGVRSEIVRVEPSWFGRIEAHMRAIIERIRRAKKDRRFPARPGTWCRYCDIAASCRERNVLVDAGVIVNDEASAQRALADMLILGGALAQREKQLKEWVTVEGPVRQGDAVLAYHDKLGGPRIANVTALIEALGYAAAVDEGMVSPSVSRETLSRDPEFRRLATTLGLDAAVKAGLLSVNGNKTRTKAVQNDARLEGLWVPGEARTEFAVLPAGHKDLAPASAEEATP